MAFFVSFIAVLALALAGLYGAGMGFQSLFGIVIPYVAVAVFIVGFLYRILDWAKSPVPFRIPTTAGQQKSLDWIKWNPIDNPSSKLGTVVRMALEVLCFRSLFRMNKVQILRGKNTRVIYPSTKWLWLFAIIFHYSFLVVFLRHFRLFMDPVPLPISLLDFFDGLFQIGAPRLYQTDVFLLVGVCFLLARRLFDDKVRYISLISDYFPLFLIIGIAVTGVLMRYFAKTDINAVKMLTMGLVTFSPTIPEGVGAIFYAHLFLVCALLIYFPFSKLMHMGGVFLSPTRNLPNDTRMHHHENPWNPPKKFHTYAAYEDDFRDLMVEAGLPVDKQPEDA